MPVLEIFLLAVLAVAETCRVVDRLRPRRPGVGERTALRLADNGMIRKVL